jgi:hypothetical protein
LNFTEVEEEEEEEEEQQQQQQQTTEIELITRVNCVLLLLFNGLSTNKSACVWSLHVII